ncbi:MAG: PIG-L family deacetylase [Gammaproteobacteria bacterium]|nr:PIG-L family deacetylase [Gammaproteobacteria bacterium]
MKSNNPFLDYVEQIASTHQKAKQLSVSGSCKKTTSDSRLLLFSPHPDDECITGLLPLRLQRELGMEIINIPVTFGSNIKRQAERSEELEAACRFLGWKNHRQRNDYLSLEVEEIAQSLEEFKPELIFVPHKGDWNTRHVSTHHLVMDALKLMGSNFSCTVIETEFWAAMTDPNLMVAADAITVADLMAATSQHVGEVIRNSYHLSLPAWMQDNVRRGSELITGQGKEVPDFLFATLYRLNQWTGSKIQKAEGQGKIIPMGELNIKALG